MQRIVTVTALLLLSWSALAQAKPKLAIIIDDLGYDMMPREVAALPPQVSVSVIPFTEFDTAVALSALSQHREVLLHLPMQSPDGTPQEPGALTLAMTQADISHAIREALYRVPQAVAVNNHMGSLLTEKDQPMHWVMAELKTHQLALSTVAPPRKPSPNASPKHTALPPTAVTCFSTISRPALSSTNSSALPSARPSAGALPW